MTWLGSTLYFASGNQHKVREIQQLLEGRFEVKSLSDLDPGIDIPETGSTLEENSKIKAAYLHDKFGVAVFADDTGLEVEALEGAPGVYSARYAGEQANSEANMDLLLANLEGKTNRSARFRTVITLIDESGIKQFEGSVEGRIIEKRDGTQGFGYDPIFVPVNHDRTFAQMDAAEKNKISHRGRAMKKFVDFLMEKA